MDIDTIKINFDQDQLFLLNICLAFLMLAVAIDIKPSDFVKVFKKPKVPIVGLISQLVLLPLLTILLILIFKPPASIALGMILVASCPGGNVSNYAVHLSQGNTAVSIILTSITTISAIFLTPLAFSLWSQVLPDLKIAGETIFVDPILMIKSICFVIVTPLILGMLLNHYLKEFTNRIRKPMKYISMSIFIGFVIFGIYGNLENIMNYLGLVFLIVLVHNFAALTMGYGFAAMNKLSEPDRRAICLETGIQNSGLGLIIIFNVFDGLGGMALIAAWWGIWHLISGFSLALFWEKRPIKQH